MSAKIWQLTAGLNGMMAVMMSAVGAHAFRLGILSNMVITAAELQMVHAVVLLWLTDKPGSVHQLARWFMLLGMVFFSGTLYAKAFFYQLNVESVTPIGGMCYILGWLFVALGPRFGKYICGKKATERD